MVNRFLALVKAAALIRGKGLSMVNSFLCHSEGVKRPKNLSSNLINKEKFKSLEFRV